MLALRLALAQVDLTVGDVPGNESIVREWTAKAAAAGAHLVAFPEMTLTGYPPEDLVFRESFAAASAAALDRLARDSGDIAVVVGHLVHDGGPRNAASLLWRGANRLTYYKHHLPNYGVFDEARYFVSGREVAIATIHGVDVALTICEDLWQPGGPVAASGQAGAELVIVINGSPYERNKDDVRGALVAERAKHAGATFAYVNAVGGQDELVYDGDSLVMTAEGRVLARAERFEETMLVIDLELPEREPSDDVGFPVRRVSLSTEPAPAGPPLPPAPIAANLPDAEEVYSAVVTCTRDYIRKNGFTSVVLGLSGGVDSAVVATIAADAIGADNVHVVAMPSRWSSTGSLTDAEELARRQGLHYSVIPIEAAVAAYDEMTKEAGGLHGLAAENLQARVRGTLLMALSNQHGMLVLTTGNKSELATGFSTLYGDSAGGFAPIKDVPKSLVWQLCTWRNGLARSRNEPEPIPESIITKPPSAELAPGQLDADRLPPYEILDAILEGYVEDDVGRAGLVAMGHDPAVVDRVIRLVDVAEHKRRQNPPGPKITPRAFGRDRRLPITNRFVDRPDA